MTKQSKFRWGKYSVPGWRLKLRSHWAAHYIWDESEGRPLVFQCIVFTICFFKLRLVCVYFIGPGIPLRTYGGES